MCLAIAVIAVMVASAPVASAPAASAPAVAGGVEGKAACIGASDDMAAETVAQTELWIFTEEGGCPSFRYHVNVLITDEHFAQNYSQDDIAMIITKCMHV